MKSHKTTYSVNIIEVIECISYCSNVLAVYGKVVDVHSLTTWPVNLTVIGTVNHFVGRENSILPHNAM